MPTNPQQEDAIHVREYVRKFKVVDMIIVIPQIHHEWGYERSYGRSAPTSVTPQLFSGFSHSLQRSGFLCATLDNMRPISSPVPLLSQRVRRSSMCSKNANNATPFPHSPLTAVQSKDGGTVAHQDRTLLSCTSTSRGIARPPAK